ENLQRVDLNAEEGTEAVLDLLEMTLDLDRSAAIALPQALYYEERGRGSGTRISDQQRSVVVGHLRRLGTFTARSVVSNRLPILEFPESLLDAVRSGRLAFTKAQAIARLEDPDDRQRLLSVALSENLSLSQIRRRITELRHEGTLGARRGGQFERVQGLVSSTKRLLNRRKLMTLEPDRLARVNALLEELHSVIREADGTDA